MGAKQRTDRHEDKTCLRGRAPGHLTVGSDTNLPGECGDTRVLVRNAEVAVLAGGHSCGFGVEVFQKGHTPSVQVSVGTRGGSVCPCPSMITWDGN